MKKYNGENPFVKKLIEKFGGKVYTFKDLPKPAQKSIFWYMAADGEAWPCSYDDSPLEALPEAIKTYGHTAFGLVNVPMKELKDTVAENFKADSDTKVMGWADFDAYHKWYMGDSQVEDHGKSVWPVILNCFDDELFQDGWHRFHTYVDRGVKKVPCLYYVG